MGKHCMIFTAFAAVVLLVGGIAFFIIYTAGDDICTSSRCVQTANELMTVLDQSVEPCDDFFDFACGNVNRLLGKVVHVQDLDEGDDHDGGRDDDEEEDYLRKSKISGIQRMIEEPEDPFDTKTLAKIKTFYRSCTRMPDGNETFGGITVEALKAVLRDIGGWPMLERGNWRENRFDWVEAVHRLRRIGLDFDAFLQCDIDVNRFDASKYILTIRAEHLGGARINTRGDKKLFVEYMVEVAAYFDVDRIRAERDFAEIMEFYEQSKKITGERTIENMKQRTTDGTSNTDELTEEFNPRSITQLQHDVPGIRWKSYLNGIVGPTVQLTPDEFVNTPNITQLRRLVDLLNKTPKKIQANYLCWRLIQSYIEYLPDAWLREKLAKFRNFRQPPRNRREICTKLIRNKMPDMVEACYVRKYVTDDVKRITKAIISAIKKELVKIVDALDWLDADIKQVSKEKLASVHEYIAHTPEMLPVTSTSNSGGSGGGGMPDVYERIDFSEGRFMANLMMIQSANADANYRKLRLTAVRTTYDEIEYSVVKNVLVLPSDYLQGFYVDPTRPLYMNFGTLGTLIAYQLSKVFLDGKRYDVHGELREWSTSQSLFNYDNKTRCLTKQYEEFYVPGIGRNVNASETQQDDVALLFGKLIAYKAYESWVATHAAEGRLPGLEYTSRQLFWIASAMDDCYPKRGRDARPVIAARGSHSLAGKSPKSISKLRVVGPLRNSEEFAKDFHCSINSYMNPEDICRLW